MTIEIPEAAMIAALIEGCKAGIKEAFSPSSRLADPGIYSQIMGQVKRQTPLIISAVLNDPSFADDFRAAVRDAIIEGARQGALEVGRKMGADAAKGAKAVESIQMLLTVGK